MRESCTSGSVRGARGNSRPYRNCNRHIVAAVHESVVGTKRRSAAVQQYSGNRRISGLVTARSATLRAA